GQDDAIDLDAPQKVRGLEDAVLSGGRVQDQQGYDASARIRFFRDPPNFLQLFHEVESGVKASGGIHHDKLRPTSLGGLNGVEDYRAWICVGLMRNERRTDTLAPD